jgi:acetyl-CoA carboxylase alpha subunit
VLQDTLRQLQNRALDDLLEARYERLMGYGKFKEARP